MWVWCHCISYLSTLTTADCELWCVYTCIYAIHMYAYIYIYICIYTHMIVSVYICMYMYVYVRDTHRICDMSQLCMWRDLLWVWRVYTCVTWLIREWDVTHSCVWRDLSISQLAHDCWVRGSGACIHTCETYIVRACDVTAVCLNMLTLVEQFMSHDF